MRLAIISSLVLVPVLAHGQTIAPAQSKPVTPSTQLRAEVTQPPDWQRLSRHPLRQMLLQP